MNKKLAATLGFFRLTDENNQLSITNILVFIFCFKFAVVQMETVGIKEMALALCAMGVYVGKKTITGIVDVKKSNLLPEELVDKLKDMGE
jgi:hypothetical protein